MTAVVDRSPVTLCHFFTGALLSLATAAFILISHHDSTIQYRSSISDELQNIHQPSSINAVLGHSVLLHAALKNDLNRMIELTEEGYVSDRRYSHWKNIFLRKLRYNEEILIPALVSRTQQNAIDTLAGAARNFDELTFKVEKWNTMDERFSSMQHLFAAMDSYFSQIEQHLLPKLLKHFSRQELWTLDSIAYNNNMDYFALKYVDDLNSWWIRNLGVKDSVKLFLSCVDNRFQSPLTAEELNELIKDIESLKNVPHAELMAPF